MKKRRHYTELPDIELSLELDEKIRDDGTGRRDVADRRPVDADPRSISDPAGAN
jgi:hypothetical protein